ncbi:tetratricopeptide repeat protein [Leptolyngbya boryana CZ1]|uniref:Tetratricopeptide repeat protein n=1 Tax=Leptolyngbya boryana CZ1 TaxID=3060204 RepID=A0AA97AUC2_LEPBY|nr:tetratricopeptide repeat protein [Leptolyngbya boryana]WNZ44126.1 tetratricopeptide repeat protein [Leptolyngbya boryana CZ1]
MKFQKGLAIAVLVCAIAIDVASLQVVQGQAPPPLSAAQAAQWKETEGLRAEMYRLYQAGEFGKAIELAEKVLAIAEKILPPNHPNLAQSINNLAFLYRAQGRLSEAEPLLQRALKIRETVLPPNHPDLAQSINNLASLYQAQGRLSEAEPLLQRALKIRETALPPNHPDLAVSINNLAFLYQDQGRLSEAEPLLQRALKIFETALPPNHPDLAVSINNLAFLYQAQGRLSEAEPLYQRALKIREAALPPNHPDLAVSINNLAFLYQAQGRLSEAEPLLQRALKIFETALPPNHPDLAVSINNLASLYQAQGRLSEAEPLLQRALKIREAALPPNHPDLAVSINNLAFLYRAQGRLSEAEPLLQRALKIFETALPPNHPNLAQSINNLASLYQDQGRLSEAEPLYQRALKIRETALPPNHPDLAVSINNLASLYQAQGRLSEAEPLLQRALKIRETALPPNHPDLAQSINNLASLYQDQGRLSEAEPLLQRALKIFETALPPNHPDLAVSINNLASLYQAQGRLSEAEPLLQRALKIRETALPPNHPDLAQSINNLAFLYQAQGRLSEAEPLLQRALKIFETALPPNHPDLAVSINNLASLYQAQGRLSETEPLLQRALKIRETALPPNHPDLAASISNLAFLYQAQGRLSEAELLYQRALKIFETALPPNHPNLATSINNLAGLYLVRRNLPQAIVLLARGFNISEQNLQQNLIVGNERTKQDFARQFSGETNSAISIATQFAPNNLAANRLAALTLLRRKGRVLDAFSSNLQALRQRLKDKPDAKKLLDQWATVQQQLSALSSRTPNQSPEQFKAQYAELNSQRRELEAALSKASAEFLKTIQPIQLADVQARIPKDSVLVEITIYQPFNPAAKLQQDLFGTSRYAAMILRTTGEPEWLDLGEAAPINQSIQTFRTALQDPSETRAVQQLARQLDRQVMQPIRQRLGTVQHLLLSPDSDLNQIPFETLQDETGKSLIDRYSISYLTSGRDLIRLATLPTSNAPPAIVADVDYDNTNLVASNSTRGGDRRSRDLASLKYGKLDGAKAEATLLKQLYPNAQLFTDKAATETAVRQLQAPSLLHFATHGFYLADQTQYFAPKPVSGLRQQPQQETFNLENPLLRSGLALAGFNSRNDRPNQSDDGVLTALEVTGLNLWGTQLVVLSACETGVGAASVGEGIYGLRRALTIAGSQTQILSLWKVDDQVTALLMRDYYTNLQKGLGRHEALRQAQLKLKTSRNYSHPYYWSGFIPSGDWSPLKGRLAKS